MKIIDKIANPLDFLNKLVNIAIQNNITDIHITPVEDDEVIIRFRKGSALINFYQLNKDSYNKLINVIKINIGVDNNSNSEVSNGKIKITMDIEGKKMNINLRVSLLNSFFGENIVIRLLPEDKNKLDVNKLGFVKQNIKYIQEIKYLTSGLVLVAGSTGSGKTTTLYSILAMFDPFKKAIYTIEDPIEYQIKGYIQTQLNGDLTEEEYRTSFNKWMRGLLRQDPNIIMVGEIKGKNSASICLEAANTGHLVLGSIHANSAYAVITRLRQLGIPGFLISGGIKYIVFQKLVNKLCTCHTKVDMTDHPMIASESNDLLNRVLGANHLEIKLAKVNPAGCEKCKNGYAGLTMISEIIKIDDKISQLIFEDKGMLDIKEYLKGQKHISLFETAIIKSINGEIDLNEVLKIKVG